MLQKTFNNKDLNIKLNSFVDKNQNIFFLRERILLIFLSIRTQIRL